MKDREDSARSARCRCHNLAAAGIAYSFGASKISRREKNDRFMLDSSSVVENSFTVSSPEIDPCSPSMLTITGEADGRLLRYASSFKLYYYICLHSEHHCYACVYGRSV